MDDNSEPPTAPYRDAGRGGIALLIVDMMNDFDFEAGARLRAKACAIASPILRLRDEVEAAGGYVIYVNDNFGEWHSERRRIVERALDAGRDPVVRLVPRDEDYFIIKPQFSGFYATNLPVLLPKLGVSRLILAGLATDICILFTAADAHMRDYALWVPEDAVAALSDERHRAALENMSEAMGAETAPTDRLTPASWLDALGRDGAEES